MMDWLRYMAEGQTEAIRTMIYRLKPALAGVPGALFGPLN